MSFEELDIAFHPDSIAVVGATDNPSSWGRFYMHWCTEYGYRGAVYPINPGRSEVLGLQAFPSLRDIPGGVDYVICCLPAPMVPGVLAECVGKEVKLLHIVAAGFGERGESRGIELEKEITERARERGVRLIGPNCMGLYYPKEGISFGYELPRESGPVGMFWQSGGLPTEFIRYAALRGIRFSKVISYGNGIDLNEADFLEYLGRDAETEVIACYLEGTRDGRRFCEALRGTASQKPVIVLKAGRGSAGTKAASSHTASLAGSSKAWDAVLRQSGAIQVQTLEEMMDLLVSFSFVPPLLGRSVGIVGGGGGKSVLSADEWEAAGFDVVSLPSEIEEKVKANLPLQWWGWIKNPLDISAIPQATRSIGISGDILRMMAVDSHFDLLVANVTVENPYPQEIMMSVVEKEVDSVMEVKRRTTKPLVVVFPPPALGGDDLRHWRWRFLAEQRSQLISAGVPVYFSVSQAARAVERLTSYCHRKASMSC